MDLNTDVEKFEGHELESLVGLLKMMLAYRPEERISAEDALKHEFFAGM